MIESAKRTDENNPAIYRWEPGADCQRVRAADDRSLTFSMALPFCRPFHGLRNRTNWQFTQQ
jgi:hypothetical protein